MEAVTPIPKIRAGNEFTFVWAISREGVAENLTAVEITDLKLTVCVGGLCAERVEVPFTIVDANKVRSSHLYERTGTYNLELTYKKSGVENEIDIEAFKIVSRTSEASDSSDFAVTSDMAIGFKGDKGDPFLYEDFTPEQLEALKVKGDAFEYSDFTPEQIAELQRPATDAAIAVNEAEALRVTAETTRVGNEQGRVTAEGTRQSNEIARENSEDDRDDAEALRLSAEITRGQNEQARITAEGLRVTAEGTRQTNTATAITNANTAATNANTKAGLADTAAINANAKATLANDAAILANEKAGLANTAATNADNARLAIQTDLALKASIDSIYKTLTIGAAGLITFKPTTSYFTYKLTVTDNLILNIDLSRMIEQVGNARCRLIIDMPIKKTITVTKPVLWGGTAPTFASAGQYVFEVIDTDGQNAPIIWQVASTTKAETTGVILYVDSTGADYSFAQITGETATRATTTWALPFKYLQNAINAATAGDIIFVKAGVYKPTHLESTPTTYVDGDCLSVYVRFTLNKAVDIYGGFTGTETKTWQRVTKEFGLMQNETILCGDVRNEAVIDPAILIGDRRTTASKANSIINIMLSSGVGLRYVHGFVFRYANSNINGAGITTGDISTVLMNCEFRDITTSAYYGGAAWYYMYSVNNFVRNTTASSVAGSTVYSFAANYNINCRIAFNKARGFNGGNNINCVALGYSETANSMFSGRVNKNCIALNNTTNNSQGYIVTGLQRNLTAINNQTQVNCPTASVTDAINCLLFGNKAGTAAGYFMNKAEAGVVKFKNNASDAANPTITGGAGSEIDLTSCIANLTALQAKITLPTFVGAPTTQAQVSELYLYLIDIPTKLQPAIDSILKGAGIKLDDVTTLDYNGNGRGLTTCTIGAIEAI